MAGVVLYLRMAFDVSKEAARSFFEDDAFGLAAQMAYHFLLALFPFLLFVAATAGMIGGVVGYENLFDLIMGYLERAAPPEARQLVSGIVTAALAVPSAGLASLGVLGMLWSASGGTGALVKALNRAYGVQETRSFWRQRLLAVLFPAVAAVTVSVALVLYLSGLDFGVAAASKVGGGNSFAIVWRLLRWPLAILFLLSALSVTYYAAPNVSQRFRWLSPGSILAMVSWFLVTAGFSFYVTNFGSFGRFYGPIGAVIVLLLWLNLCSLAILAGGELDAALARRFDPFMIRDRHKREERKR